MFVVHLQKCSSEGLTYHIASNYGRSCINAWSCLVAGGISIVTKMNAGSQINARSVVGPP